MCRGCYLKLLMVTLSWEISIFLPRASLRCQRWVRSIFLFALAPKCHGNCHKYLCWTNIGALRYFLGLWRSHCHKGRWRFVTLVQHEFTSTTAKGAEPVKKKKSQLCSQAPLSSTHLPVKTLGPWFISKAFHPNPHLSLTHTFLHIPIQIIWDAQSCTFISHRKSFEVNGKSTWCLHRIHSKF